MEMINKSARFNYFVVDELEVGIQLLGHEVKSLLNSNTDLKPTHITIEENELWIHNLYIKNYDQRYRWGEADPKRKRKLLAHRREINKLYGQVQQKGMTLIPLKITKQRGGKFKVVLGVCRGKNVRDKRETIKQRDLKRLEKQDY